MEHFIRKDLEWGLQERVMVSDLAEAGAVRCQVRIFDGMQAGQMFESCLLIPMTGLTLANVPW